MHSVSHAEIVARDLCCNWNAFWAGVSLVRVHECNLQQPDAVMAAIQQLLYPYCSTRTDAYGNTVIAKADMPTW